jgi:phage repressor protein C with HTH and peptisase S24 domain
MLSHSQIWRAIDGLAARHGLSPSGLARLAGLDPTTFNKSKRGGDGGKLRWPSTESLSKVLAATGSSVEDFLALVSGSTPIRTRMVPLIGMAQAGTAGYFDDAGFPSGSGWEDIVFPEVSDPNCYALEITGDSMTPVYRDGDRILVSPSGSVRRGDRVVVKTKAGEVMAKSLGRMTAQRIELKSFNPAFEDRHFALNELAFIHRIIWASQ